MLSRRLVVNLIAFFVISAALVVFGVVDLLGNPFRPATPISAVFSDASGVSPNFSVELNGVDVGSVTAVRLAHGGADVSMAIDPGITVPANVVASIDVANDLGEQVVELTPTQVGRSGTLRAGALVPVSGSGLPADIGQVVAAATRLLRDIPSERLNQLLTDLSQGLAGRAGDLRTIVTAGTTFSEEFLHYQQQFRALLANAPPVLDAVTAAGPQLRQALLNTESLLSVLAQHRNELGPLFAQGANAFGDVGSLVMSQEPNLACSVHDLSQLAANLAQPTNLSFLSQTLADNEYFFGAVEKLAVTGLAEPLTSHQSADPTQEFLRTRLLIPPATPSAVTYSSPTALPAVEPGAACSTEFGNGAGAATQPGFTAAAGGSVVTPTAAESRVRGGGDPPAPPAAPSSAPSAFVDRTSPGPELAAMALVMVALALAYARRPSRVRSRRR